MRFIRTTTGENLSAVARRLFAADTPAALRRARERLVELNPGLPERANIPEGTIVLVPTDLDGEPPRDGRGFDQVSAEVVKSLQGLLGDLGAALDEAADAEARGLEEQQALIARPEVRRAAAGDPELAARLTSARGELEKRRARSDELKRLRKETVDGAAGDLDVLGKLTGSLPNLTRRT
jgi:hypothetical protein